MLMSSGHEVGSTPIGTSLKVASGCTAGDTLRTMSRNDCSTVGARHARRHFTTHIWLKRCFTSERMVAAFATPWPAFTMSKKPPISGVAMSSMNWRSFDAETWFTRPPTFGKKIEMTGSGVFGAAVLSSGKRPLTKN